MRHIYGFFVQEDDEGVIDDFEAQEAAFIFMETQSRSWKEVHRRLLHFGEEDWQEERDYGVMHLQYNFLIG